jgi:hypothetical protein
MFQTNRRRFSVDVQLVIVVTPVERQGRSRVLIKAYPYTPIVLGEGFVLLRQEISVSDPNVFSSAHTYVLDTLAKVCHEIANEVEEAGYTTIEDLMLKLSEQQ